MQALEARYARLGTADAPGQELRLQVAESALGLHGGRLAGTPVDFSHGDVDAFEPTPGALDAFVQGFGRGGAQAYTEYRGTASIRGHVAAGLSAFTATPVSGADDLIVTNGTQGALFLAVAAVVARGTRVAVVQPDYFANRKLVEFFEGVVVPVELAYLGCTGRAGLDLQQLEDAFRGGVEVFLFSNPNNPTGVVYSAQEIRDIARLAQRYGVTVIVDQLYARLLYGGETYHHLRAEDVDPDRVLTIMGPSKTESLSGLRLGVAFGAPRLIERMEKLQAIVSLRAAGYNQAALLTWFAEPQGWMAQRIAEHQAIRDTVVHGLSSLPGMQLRTPQAGSYVFPRLPRMGIAHAQFVHALRLQADVIVAPGRQFGPASGDSIRLNFSQDRQAARSAVERIVELARRYGG